MNIMLKSCEWYGIIATDSATDSAEEVIAGYVRFMISLKSKET